MNRAQLKKELPFFKKVSLFYKLDDKQINEIIDIMKLRHVKAGEMITQEGSDEDTVFILLKGEVEISKRLLLPLWEGESSHQEKSLIHLSEHDHPFFGEMILFEDKPERSASIFAVHDSTLAVMQKQDMLAILDKNPQIGSVIYKNIAQELTFRLIKANHDILKLTTAFCLALEGE